MRRPLRKEVLVALGGVVVVATMAAVAAFHSTRRTAVVRLAERSNLTMIGIALHSYHFDYGSLPPAHTTDRNGKPMHSWRSLLLPYVEGSRDLYSRIDFDLPWNDPHNQRVASSMPVFYRYPGDADAAKTATDYVVCLDPKGLWPGRSAAKLANDGTRLDEVLLLEITHSDIEWMEPRDLTLKEVLDATHRKQDTRAPRLQVVAYVTVAGEICVIKDKNDLDLLYTRLGTRPPDDSE